MTERVDIRALIDRLEAAVEEHADQISNGTSAQAERAAEEARRRARQALEAAIGQQA